MRLASDTLSLKYVALIVSPFGMASNSWNPSTFHAPVDLVLVRLTAIVLLLRVNGEIKPGRVGCNDQLPALVWNSRSGFLHTCT
jgi:hypothetical protein